MKVLFAAAEAVPFAKTGGLADVIGSLPKELRRQDVDVRVILPQYQDIPQRCQQQMAPVRQTTVPVGWRQQYCGVKQLTYQGVVFYFIDNEYYFKRSGFYGYYDDAERYAFFCRAVLEVLPLIDFQPDVIHCHDWHTGLISVFLEAYYRDNAFYDHIHTLFTIHNLRYQGVFSKDIFADILALDWSYFTADKLEFFDQVNFMKGGLAFSELISTVSKTYAQEIQYPYFGEQLDGMLRRRRDDLTGIVNGIDYDQYNPVTDSYIAVNYNADSFHLKQANKASLQDLLRLPVKRGVPLLAIVSRLVDSKGLDLVACIMDEFVSREDVQLVVLGTGEANYQQMFQHFAWQYPAKVSVNLFFDDQLAQQIYGGADMLLMPSNYEPCGISQLIALRYGTIPVVRETGGLKDTVHSYNKYTEQGNGFSFANYNAHEFLYTMKRALGLFYDKPVWEKIVRNAMASDYSWQRSAKQYVELYQRLVKGR
ncbi:MAG: glycogen synthase GlgA [Veillonellales bacterium]